MYARIFGEGGTLAQYLDRFEPRQVQVDVANAVAEACREGQRLLLEAGTGVGKSLAYLVPILEWTAQTDGCAVISTCTKTLQHQLLHQDVPLARKATGLQIPYALGLGGENYLCTKRLELAIRGGGADVRLPQAFLNWTSRTRTGVRDQCPSHVSDRVWRQVCRNREFCSGKECRAGGTCFFQKARSEMRKAKLLIVNHSLLFSDIRTGRSILPSYDVLVLDEAHDLEDIATQHLGHQISRSTIYDLLSGIGLSNGPRGVIEFCFSLTVEQRNELRQAADQALSGLEHTMAGLRRMLGLAERLRIREDLSPFDELSAPLQRLRAKLRAAANKLRETDDAGQLDGSLERLDDLLMGVQATLGPPDEELVRWIDTQGRGDMVIGAVPIEIGPLLNAELYSRLHSTILVSATMRVDKRFDFIRERLGVPQPKTCAFDSPFDFARQMVLYVPEDGPEPSAGDEYLDYLTDQILALVERVRGGCFALFTNRQQMQQVHEMLRLRGTFRTREDPPGFLDARLILIQGELGREPLLDLFRKDGQALLLGTNTFWQGVDVPGDALRCVIICRFPFRMPDDPIVEARMEHLARQGRSPFTHYQLPQAVMMFLQGVGRLIRHRNDTGVVAILDQRMRSKGYGSLFYRSLPACHGTADLDEVQAAFGG